MRGAELLTFASEIRKFYSKRKKSEIRVSVYEKVRSVETAEIFYVRF